MTAPAPFATVADAAFALLSEARAGRTRLSRKAASFAGQCVVDPTPLSPKQKSWIDQLVERAGLPEIAE